ncbi:MAG: endonuclease Q family protein [archaeon GB-1867-005]|nr:endonuclease Q family protein [Candidatus Culexmicrobium cathedralense]
MRVYADLHIHSHYSAATSKDMVIPEIAQFAKIKGLNLVGTGDALHPSWIRELKMTLEESSADGLYTLRGLGEGEVYFIAQTEVGTIFEFEGKVRRVHHVILMPNLEVAEQLSDMLSFYGNVASDGRPTFNMKPAELVELVMELDDDNFVFPAHAWTPWWSIFGAFSGVDRVEDCYEDQTKNIYAIETGLSSDPSMNWRVSNLDKYALVSFSDAHSPWPFRLGREACVFDLKRLSYREVISAIKSKDPKRFIMTIEVEPKYGKYHFSGHRKCGVGPLSPEEAAKLGYRCPVCGRKLTKGVEDRVEELADRPHGYKPPNAVPFIKLLPLQEIIASILGVNPRNVRRLYSGSVWREYLNLISHFGSEYCVLIEAPLRDIATISSNRLAEAIGRLRRGGLKVIPGYDGVYGKIVLFEEESQLSLGEFIT